VQSRERIFPSSCSFIESYFQPLGKVGEVKLSQIAGYFKRSEDVSDRNVPHDTEVQPRLEHEVYLISNMDIFLCDQQLSIFVNANVKFLSIPSCRRLVLDDYGSIRVLNDPLD